MRLSDVTPDYLSYITHEIGHSPRTATCYGSRLRHAVRWLEANGYPDPDISVFTAPVLRRYLYAESARGLRPRTLRGLFNPLQGLGDFLVAQGLLPENPVRTIKMPKMDAAERRLALDRDLTALMTALELQADQRKLRFERALFSVLINCGPRAAELLGMKVSHFSQDADTLLVAHGKGEKARTLHPPTDTGSALREWILEREKMGCSHDWLWAITKTRRLGYDGLRDTLKEAKARAGLAGNDTIHCHAIRRAFATRMMTRGGSIKAIQAALGHTQTETTFRYLFLAEEGAKAMADIGALAAPPKVAPEPLSEPKQVAKIVDRAAFVAHRRRTPAK